MASTVPVPAAGRNEVLREAARVSAAIRQAGDANAHAHAADLAPVLRDLQAQGVTGLHSIARALTDRCVPTAKGGKVWQAVQVARVLKRASS